jgi:hypothetical protein
MTSRFLRTVPAAVAFLAAAAASAQTFTFQIIEVPKALATEVRGFGPNGEALGTYANGLTFHGLIDDNGAFKTVNVPHESSTILASANATTMVGQASSKLVTVGFTLNSTGTFTTFQVPGANNTYASGIDAAGTIFGYYNVPSGLPEEQGFILNKGTYTTFKYPNANDTEVTGMNSSGQIVGSYRLADSFAFNGFLYADGKFTTISYPGAFQTNVQGINSLGEIVGYYSTSENSGYIGFVLNGATFTSFSAPNATSTYAYGINDAGQVAGFAISPTTAEFGYIATPE